MIHRSSAIAAFVLLAALGSTYAACSGGGDGNDGAGGTSADPSGPPCKTDADCVTGNPCSVGACDNGHCTTITVPDGLAPGTNVSPDDCVTTQCSNGQLVMMQADDSQAPDDYNDCTTTHCDGGKWHVTNAKAGTACGTKGQCDSSGHCTGCTAPSDCGTDSYCHTRTCADSICGVNVREAGTVLPDDQQEAGDCKRKVCDGKGGIHNENDDKDVPVDKDPCTDDACKDGMPSNDPAKEGTDCGDGTVCSKDGKCVQCVSDDQCMAPDTCGAYKANECACKPEDKAFSCNGHCGPTTGNCGQMVDCGGCTSGWVCNGGSCCAPQPKDFTCKGIACGSVMDNCGQMVTCDGTCTPPETCGGGGQANKCGCTDDGSACQGKNCGTVTNNCGMTITCAPNVCQPPATCGGGGAANVCGCTDDGSACQGKECGTAKNNCGQTVTCMPNSCPDGKTCGASQPNICG